MLKAVFMDAGEVLLHMPPWPGRVRSALHGLGVRLPDARIEAAIAQGEAWRRERTHQDLAPSFAAEERLILGHMRVIAGALGHGGVDARYLLQTCHYPAVAEVFDDVRPALAHLRALGLRIGVISNAPPSMRPALVQRDLHRAVDQVTLSSDVGVLKPEPQVYREALARMGVEPYEAAYVDDLPANVDTARVLGFARTHVVDRDGHAPERRDRLSSLAVLPMLLAPQAPAAHGSPPA